MSGEPETVRSYQRIFTPERRIHQVEGHRLPVPGGVPLRWLGWALGSLLAILALASGFALVPVGAAAAAGAGGLAVSNRTTGLLAAAAALVGTFLAGQILGVIDWPLRLVVLPVAVATAATQTTPDGRRAERFAASWLALQLSPRRRSLGRAVPRASVAHSYRARMWVDPDWRGSLRPARVEGPAILSFAAPMAVRRGRILRRQLLARPSTGAGLRRLRVEAGETLEVRP